MPQLRIRITGSDDDLRAVADLLQSLKASSTWRKWPT